MQGKILYFYNVNPTTMDAAVANAVESALERGETLPCKPAPKKTEPDTVYDSDECEEEPMSEDDEPTAEDLAFINDGRVEESDFDTASLSTSNIITSKRTRRPPQRWEHPDTQTVMAQYMKRKGISEEDLQELEEDDGEPIEEPSDEVSDYSDVDENDEGSSTIRSMSLAESLKMRRRKNSLEMKPILMLRPRDRADAATPS